ncbi:type 2 GTP cyclohydrolase I [Providencia stuartii]|uniref:GTP cyclohydrolase 1 type 2 homolog n=1 Tax=Providencia stuartii TaxID=588 RepID=A0A1S1HW16_PROST|nr:MULTISPECIES: type 2 GTP cyclohydrolase I [Providencia]ELR5038761.1 type 2 GTP cyclohydrolase I [Providencia stuartii]ELR5082048.1 type 2 GTP cyclohydrolase I [Providencia stuartii]ELR5112845.1 type 2 GTP cyclohydrolase I [Providencia stuartii]ELR5301844.1 type 2 GTP cyclohydrolase I [Providencia stuartii]MDW7590311.1 type 2 GTP cyclohydrolase I [Providencia sp. 2023EL-00965]
MRNLALEELINNELKISEYQDYAPNGLQVEGRSHVQKIVTGVTACQALLDKAVEMEADAIIVHHGYFWKNEPSVIKGMKRKRLKTLLENDINLYGYHLPLDAHHQLGNNTQLAHLMGVKIDGHIDPLMPFGYFDQPITPAELNERLESRLGRKPLHCGDTGKQEIRQIAWCTGGGQGFILQAAEFGVDAFVTGEVSEQTIHIAREMGIHFYSAGHHATERYGIKALTKWLVDHHNLDATFVDIDNPA